MTAIRKYWIALIFSGLSVVAFAQHENEQNSQLHTPPAGVSQEQNSVEQNAYAAAGVSTCGEPVGEEKEGEFNAGATAIHHIADANAIHIFGNLYLHLPCILYAPDHGWTLTTTSAFHPHHHGNGEVSKDGYVLLHGNIMRFKGADFLEGEHEVKGYTFEEISVNGKTKSQYYASIEGHPCLELESKSTFDGGLMGGGVTSFYDFSITRNVFTMILTALLLFFVFRVAATSAVRTQGQAPKGLQNFIEPFYTFIRDDVAKPSIGPHYEKYMPFLLSVFFFILGLNLIGQIPFFPGSANVTGNISITIVLALITFVLMLLSSNKHFWAHTLWMPGVPAALKILILTPVEILSLLLKPFTLLLRLFANITAGHVVVLCFVGLIFIFGKAGTSVGGSITGAATAIPLTLFMMALEILVAFLQAFIFTMLSATYFGMAVEGAHDEHH